MKTIPNTAWNQLSKEAKEERVTAYASARRVSWTQVVIVFKSCGVSFRLKPRKIKDRYSF